MTDGPAVERRVVHGRGDGQTTAALLPHDRGAVRGAGQHPSTLEGESRSRHGDRLDEVGWLGPPAEQPRSDRGRVGGPHPLRLSPRGERPTVRKVTVGVCNGIARHERVGSLDVVTANYRTDLGGLREVAISTGDG